MDQKLGQPLWHGWPLALVLCSGTSFALGWYFGTQINVYPNRVVTRLERFPHGLRERGAQSALYYPLFLFNRQAMASASSRCCFTSPSTRPKEARADQHAKRPEADH